MESSALASLMPPPAASAAATGAAFAAVLGATELTAGGPDPLALAAVVRATPAAPPVPEGGNQPPPAANGGRSPFPPGEEAPPLADAAAEAAMLLEALAGASGTPPLHGATMEEPGRPARRAVGFRDGEPAADGLAMSPLAVAIRTADLRPATTAGLGPATPGAAEDVARGTAPVGIPAEFGSTARRFALPGADGAARPPGPADPHGAAAMSPSLPLPFGPPVAFAAGAGGQAYDAQGLSAAWASVDDARLAAFARRGADAPAADPLDIDAPIGGRAWDRALGERVLWLVGQQIQAAEIKLNPPHLGPVEVRLTLSGSEASLSFGTPHAPVREAIEQALPRLREQLAEQNLVLVNVDVGDRGVFGQAQGRQEARHSAFVPTAAQTAPEAQRAGHAGNRGESSGLVDEYA
ncbi:MAG: flagellar hook-length control protein FliK [Gammaproteobacteria bacterium]|nr:flagellar hook-length control protein FliK [Gammaproteobacteria bacterium]